MNHLFNLLQACIEWLRARFARRYKTRRVNDDLPPVLDRHTVYIVQDEDVLWHVSLVCPCGCNAVLHMNLIPDERPCWQLQEHADGTASLHPSVWRQRGCRSHFWLRQGRIIWCDYNRAIEERQILC